MIVFVEEIFLQGFCFCFFALFLTQKLMGKTKGVWSIILLSAVYGVADTLLLRLQFAFFGEALYRLLILLLVSLLLSKGLKDSLVRFVLTSIFLLVMVGLREVLLEVFGMDYIWLSLVLSGGLVLLIGLLIRHFYMHKKHLRFEYSVSFCCGQNVYKGIAYLDSGNFLQDDLTGLPIVIIDYHIFLHLTGIKLNDLFEQKYHLKNSHYVDYDALGTIQKMLVFEIDSVEIEGEEARCLLGLNIKGFDAGYNAILSPLVV